MGMISTCSLMEQRQPLQRGTSSLYSLGRQSSERTGKKNVSHTGTHQEEESPEDKQSFPYTSSPQPVAYVRTFNPISGPFPVASFPGSHLVGAPGGAAAFLQAASPLISVCVQRECPLPGRQWLYQLSRACTVCCWASGERPGLQLSSTVK